MDDDDKKSEDEPAEPARDAAQEESATLRAVSAEELERILDAHKTSCETGGKEGEKADLSRADLREADLQGAFLTGAKLQGADLFCANLQGADLAGANLQGANLRSANLTNAKSLTREQLDEACGDDETKLPDYLADYQMKACPEPAKSPSN